MAVASLRAQVEAGAQAVQLFDSWAGSLSPDEYARFALPATRAVLEGIADLGVPTILFGVGTGELLGLMGSAGSDVVGVDWRVPLDEARRRVGPGHALQGNLDPALCLAPWPVVAEASPSVLAAARRRHRDRPRLQPGSRRPARVGPWHPGRRRRAGPRGDRAGHDDRRAPHGARHAGEHDGDRALLHTDPARPSARRRSSWPSSRGAMPRSAACPHSPSAPPPRSMPCAPRSTRARPAATWCRSAPSTRSRSSRRLRPRLAAAGVERVIGLVLTPHGSTMGSQEYLDRAAAALGTTPFVAVGPWYAEPSLVALLADRVQEALAHRRRAGPR